MSSSRRRLLLINAFSLPAGSAYLHRRVEGPKESLLVNYAMVEHLLADVDWDLHPGALTTYGDWPVESREEFCLVAAARLPIVREACESGKYDAIVLLGGGEPGILESREIARPYGIPVTSCGLAQMHYATLLGNKFSVLDLAEIHNMYYYNLIVQHRYDQRCASIRNLDFPLPRPGPKSPYSVREEKEKALRGERQRWSRSQCGKRSPPSRKTAPRSSHSAVRPPSGCSRSSSGAWLKSDGTYRCLKGTAAP